ncbi:MAG TPA: hypothetical protein VKN14_09700 [Flavobacteriaceae bacterium]|nr:hypothetical protein [Flavobacteriaceae bacterium]
MKTLKTTLLLIFIICVTYNVSAQQMYQVHVDYVNPSHLGEYNEVAKEFTDACKEHNPQTKWITATMNDNRYMYVSPIENFAELDANPFADMAEKMGDDFSNMFQRFNTCYDKHGDYILVLNNELSYMPEGMSQTQEGQNYRKFFFLYHTPENHAKIREAMKGVKEMFASKNSPEHYRVYHAGFGTDGDYYMVAISSKDEIDSATRGKANDELLGEEAKPVFQKVMQATSKFEEYDGWIRTDLSYSPSEE